MTPYERVRTTFAHQEPDRVPFDLGSTHITGIHHIAYRKLLDYLGMDSTHVEILRRRVGTASMSDELLDRFAVDIRGVFPNDYPAKITHDKEYSYYTDEWGITWRSHREGGLYYDVCRSPLTGQLTRQRLEQHKWPELSDPSIIAGMADRARCKSQNGNYPCVLETALGSEVFDGSFFIRGFQDFYMDLAADPNQACYLMDQMLDIQLRYWSALISEVDLEWFIVRVGDDLGEQTSTRISPEMYRELVKPRHVKLFRSIKKYSNNRAVILFHSDGSVYKLIPDLIEAGIDALNPVQYTATNMGTNRLKREFGKDLVFWGGGIDTQHILPHGTPHQVRDEVNRRIDDLAPGGGFVFAQVHNIQADVPPQNIIAMWEALGEHRRSSG